MRAIRTISGQSQGRLLRCLVVTGVLLACAPVSAAMASAPVYQQVRLFEEPAFTSHLEAATGLALNLTGAGGVTPGTLYGLSNKGLIRYSPAGIYEATLSSPGGSRAIAIDQTTGDIYTLGGPDGVQRFSATGTLLESFGEIATDQESIEVSPQAFHELGGASIAVDDSGTVYVGDYGYATAERPQTSRVMVFKPEVAGTTEHYVYSGRAGDIARESGGSHVGLDSHGNLFVLESDDILREYSLSSPNVPVCEIETTGGVDGLAVDPTTSELIYDSDKNHEGHQLLCNTSTGMFEALGAFPITPEPTASLAIEGLAINPSLVLEEDRAPGVLYMASSSGGGYLFAKPAHHEPVVESEGVGDATATSATVSATINPHGAIGRYVFEYLTEAQYEENESSNGFQGAMTAPVGGAPMPQSAVSTTVSTSLSGLTPGTRYRYRVVLTGGEAGPVTGEPEVFATYQPEEFGLPDGRVYELVSPLNKSGGEVITPVVNCQHSCSPGAELTHFPMESTADGEALVYEGTPFGPDEGGVLENEYIARRGSDGWHTTTLSPSLIESSSGSGYMDFSEDLSSGVIFQLGTPLTSDAPLQLPSLYLQSTASPTRLSSLLRSESEQIYHRPEGRFDLIYEGGSSDLSHVVFEANDALTGATSAAPEAVDGGESATNIYESTEGQLRLVNVLPGNAQTVPGAYIGGDHAVSEDGSRIFWTSAAGQLYVRVNALETVAIGPPEACSAAVPEAQRVCFSTASADGSEVLMSNGQLYVLNSGTGSYEAASDLTQGLGGFRGVAGASEDLTTVYFVDTKVLGGTNARSQTAVEGANNLYVFRRGEVAFIASVSAAHGSESDWGSIGSRTAESSANGEWLAFTSQARLTGYDNVGPCEYTHIGNGRTSGPCGEVFVYGRESGQTACVSCNRSLAAPLGTSTLPLINAASHRQMRYVTNSGRVYFDSEDSLVAGDTNAGVEDVYQYEPEGVGSCALAGGCVSLISGGHGSGPSQFVAVDSTGKNIFIATRDSLVAADHDERFDIYDAREGGGFADESEAPVVGCAGDECGGTSPPPTEPYPGSLSFSGSGNLLAPALTPTSSSSAAKPLTRVQKLARALRACKKKSKRRRPTCVRQAEKKYGTRAKKASHHQEGAR
jgi:hypothetical protein